MYIYIYIWSHLLLAPVDEGVGAVRLLVVLLLLVGGLVLLGQVLLLLLLLVEVRGDDVEVALLQILKEKRKKKG